VSPETVGQTGTGYERLGRHAAGGDAGPAKELSFNVGHRLAGADDDRVKSVPPSAAPIGSGRSVPPTSLAAGGVEGPVHYQTRF